MKRLLRTSAFVFLFLYVSCQKEVTGIVPSDTTVPADSTGTDSTITDPADSLAIYSFMPDSGRAGTLVTITGIGFDLLSSGNTVAINGTPAEVINGTASGLVVMVGEGTTTGKIAVTAYNKTAVSSKNFVVLPDTASTTNSWTQKADTPMDGQFVNGFSINGKGYFFTGHSLWQYDPEADLWTQKKSLSSGTGHSYGFCFVIGNKAYVGLGANMPGEDYYDEYNRNHHNYQEVWEYDASLDNWTQKQDFPGAPRVIPFTFSANGFGFMGGGDTTNYNAGHTQDFWKYDPTTDNWTRLADFPGKISMGFSGFSLHNNGYVLEVGPGNPTAPTGAEYSQRLWKYNLGTNNWEQKAPLPTRNFITGTVFTISNKAYAAIGVYLEPEDAPAERADFWQYNPDTNAWTKKPDAGGGIRWFGSSFAIGSKGYLGLGNGGMYGSSKKDFWEYAPD